MILLCSYLWYGRTWWCKIIHLPLCILAKRWAWDSLLLLFWVLFPALRLFFFASLGFWWRLWYRIEAFYDWILMCLGLYLLFKCLIWLRYYFQTGYWFKFQWLIHATSLLTHFPHLLTPYFNSIPHLIPLPTMASFNASIPYSNPSPQRTYFYHLHLLSPFPFQLTTLL